jgi:FixJ family two-component response regulator
MPKLIDVVDDDAAMRDALSTALGAAGYRVGSFASANEFWREYEVRQPHLLLIDLMMSIESGLMLCRRLAAMNSLTTSFAVISGQAQVADAVEAMKLGAIDVLEKPFGLQRVFDVAAIAVARSESLREQIAERKAVKRNIAKLTPREHEILRAISSGKITKEIARQHGISPRTVDVHRSRIMEKLELTSSSQLAHVISVLYTELRSGFIGGHPLAAQAPISN